MSGSNEQPNGFRIGHGAQEDHSNPVWNPDPIDNTRRFQSLGEYLVSLARIRTLRRPFERRMATT